MAAVKYEAADSPNQQFEVEVAAPVLGDLATLLPGIFDLFAMPEVENAELLFEEMMDALSLPSMAQLDAAAREHHVLLQQELCLFVCRLAHFHTTRKSAP